MARAHGRVAVVHLDAHLDTWDPKVLGGGVSAYAGVNHGTFLHIAHAENLTLGNSVHVGVRAPVEDAGVVRHDGECGFGVVMAGEIEKGVAGVVRRIRERVGGSRVYVSVDVDVLDPSVAPGTGTAEVGGWSAREVLGVLAGLEGLEVVGGDVVEVSPAYDGPGEVTGLVAAEVAKAVLQLMVGKKREGERGG